MRTTQPPNPSPDASSRTGPAMGRASPMRINADLSAPAAVAPEEHRWVGSPQAGVERVMLDRVGGEVARATSLVRYAPGARFPAHRHPGGEEILVLAGTFSDEHGDYPAGWYLRNPPGSMHRPHSGPGALILVKLCQMRPEEVGTVRVDTAAPHNWHRRDGRSRCALFDDGMEQVFLERLADTDRLAVPRTGGIELFVLSGALSVDGRPHGSGSWIRMPWNAGPSLQAMGASTVFVKTGHLPAPQRLEAPR